MAEYIAENSDLAKVERGLPGKVINGVGKKVASISPFNKEGREKETKDPSTHSQDRNSDGSGDNKKDDKVQHADSPDNKDTHIIPESETNIKQAENPSMVDPKKGFFQSIGDKLRNAFSHSHSKTALSAVTVGTLGYGMFGGSNAEASSIKPVKDGVLIASGKGQENEPEAENGEQSQSEGLNVVDGAALGLNGVQAAMGAKELKNGEKAGSIVKDLASTSVKEAGGMGKFLMKKLPGVGLVTGSYFAYDRASHGDYTGAALEMVSGIASLVPGVGTMASAAIDAGLLARDAGVLDANNPNNQDAMPQVTGGSKPVNRRAPRGTITSSSKSTPEPTNEQTTSQTEPHVDTKQVIAAQVTKTPMSVAEYAGEKAESTAKQVAQSNGADNDTSNTVGTAAKIVAEGTVGAIVTEAGVQASNRINDKYIAKEDFKYPTGKFEPDENGVPKEEMEEVRKGQKVPFGNDIARDDYIRKHRNLVSVEKGTIGNAASKFVNKLGSIKDTLSGENFEETSPSGSSAKNETKNPGDQQNEQRPQSEGDSKVNKDIHESPLGKTDESIPSGSGDVNKNINKPNIAKNYLKYPSRKFELDDTEKMDKVKKDISRDELIREHRNLVSVEKGTIGNAASKFANKLGSIKDTLSGENFEETSPSGSSAKNETKNPSDQQDEQRPQSEGDSKVNKDIHENPFR